MKNILKTAFINAFLTGLYVVAIANFIFHIPKNFDQTPTPLIPVFMLLLFIFSAALTGSLVFGKPILWYLDGQKKEALQLLSQTLLIIFIFACLSFVALSLSV